MERYNPIKIEEKWQKIWEERSEFKAERAADSKNQKMFLAEMF